VGVRRHTDLDAWKLASELRDRTRRLTEAGRFSRHPWLNSQLARASQSACANVAEGFGRYQPKDFARFLRVARGSLLEATEHLENARQLRLITEPELDELSQLANRAVGAVTRLIRYLDRAKAP
jgi:four helix bundle protein